MTKSNYSPCIFIDAIDGPAHAEFLLDAAKFANPRTWLEAETYFDGDGGGEYFPESFVDDLKEDDAGAKAATLIAIAAIRSPVARDFIFQVLDRLEDVFAPECQGLADGLKDYINDEIESAFLAYEEERAQLDDEDDEEETDD